MENRRDGRTLARQDFAFGVLHGGADSGLFAGGENRGCGTAVGGAVAVIVAQIGVGMGVRASAGQLAQRIGSCGDRLRTQRLARKIRWDLGGNYALDIAFERQFGRRAVNRNGNGLRVRQGRGVLLGYGGVFLRPEAGQQAERHHKQRGEKQQSAHGVRPPFFSIRQDMPRGRKIEHKI